MPPARACGGLEMSSAKAAAAPQPPPSPRPAPEPATILHTFGCYFPTLRLHTIAMWWNVRVCLSHGPVYCCQVAFISGLGACRQDGGKCIHLCLAAHVPRNDALSPVRFNGETFPYIDLKIAMLCTCMLIFAFLEGVFFKLNEELRDTLDWNYTCKSARQQVEVGAFWFCCIEFTNVLTR